MRRHLTGGLVIVAALVGIAFAAVSTNDFMAHLDRQVHGIHCSFIPGTSSTDAGGSSGCRVALMSPYSSVLREQVWGGIPVSLPGLALFCFILFWAASLELTRRLEDPRATGFLLLATLVPLVTSVVMGYIAFARLGAACRSCIGIYTASGLAFLGALALWIDALLTARRRPAPEGDQPPAPATEHLGWGSLVVWSGVGAAFVAVPLLIYALIAPDFDRYIGSCGTLASPTDPGGVMLSFDAPAPGRVEAIEVLDPLCPACLAFEHRLEASQVASKIRRRVVLFPLDSTCNWMISDSLHPGACAVSEAMLCANERAEDVLAWAFSEQEEIRRAAAADPEAAARLTSARFPELASCIGSAAARDRLNRGLRWAVRNQLPVLSPQLYVEGTRLCDEDTDLGLEFMLNRLVERARPAAPRVATSRSTNGGL